MAYLGLFLWNLNLKYCRHECDPQRNVARMSLAETLDDIDDDIVTDIIHDCSAWQSPNDLLAEAESLYKEVKRHSLSVTIE